MDGNGNGNIASVVFTLPLFYYNQHTEIPFYSI